MLTKTLDLPNWLTRIRETASLIPRGVAAPEDDIPELYQYALRDPLLSPTDTQFYQVLHAVVGKRVVVCPKMRMADLFKVKAGAVTKENEQAHAAFQKRIQGRSLDFVLCERYTLRPLLAIELYDHSQPKGKRKVREQWVDKLFKSAKLPILHLVAQAEYNAKLLAQTIAPYMTMVIYERGINVPAYALAPRCPCCHTPMVKRTVFSGDYHGKQFFACQNFPGCCQRQPLSKAIAYVN